MEDFKFHKVLTPLQAWSYSYGCLLGWGGFVMTATVFLPQGGVAGSLLAFAVGALFIAMIALNYHYLSSLCPANGGIFYLLQNTMGRGHAFAASWAICFAHLLIIPLNARALARLVRALLAEYAHMDFQIHLFGLNVMLVDFIIILIALAISAFINSKGIRISARIQTVFAITLAAGIAILFFMAIFSGVDIKEKMTPAFYPDRKPLESFMLIFVMIPWAFVGFDSVPALSREAAFPKKKLGMIMVWAVAIGASGYMANIVITLLGAPEPWPLYIRNMGNGLESIAVVASARRMFGTAGLVISLITLLAAILTGINGSVANVSRLVYTMSRSNSLFPILGKTNKNGVPAMAINFAVLASLLLVLVATTFNTMEMVASICTAFGYGYCSLSAFVNAKKHHDKRYLITGAAGLASCALWLVFLTVPILPTESVMGVKMYASLAVWAFVGIWGYAVTCRKPDTVLDF